MSIWNYLFQKSAEQDDIDSVYNRRKARGELPNQLEIQRNLKRKVEEQEQLVARLFEENQKLRKELTKAADELKRNEVMHSLDEVIDAMKKQPEREEIHYNPFAMLRRPSANGDSDGSMAGNSFEPEQYCEDIPDDAEYGDEEIDIDDDDIGDDER